MTCYLFDSMLNICSQGTPKMLSNKKSSRTGSKVGDCPRPLVYSSYPFPVKCVLRLIYFIKVFSRLTFVAYKGIYRESLNSIALWKGLQIQPLSKLQWKNRSCPNYQFHGLVLIHFLNLVRVMSSVQATQSIIRLLKQVLLALLFFWLVSSNSIFWIKIIFCIWWKWIWSND